MSNGISGKEKIVISVLCVWSFIHTYLLITNYTKVIHNPYFSEEISSRQLFYPFTSYLYKGSRGYMLGTISEQFQNFDLRFYDYTEYFVYVGGVWMIYFIYRYLKVSK